MDFRSWPYPSATRFIVEQMKDTLVSGDTGFLQTLDPDFVAGDLVDDRFVRKSLIAFPSGKQDGDEDPFVREEVIRV